MATIKLKWARRFLRGLGKKFRVRESLIVGLIVTIPFGVIWFVSSILNSFVKNIVSGAPFGHYLQFPFAGLIAGIAFLYFAGFFLTSRGRLMRITDWTLNRVPPLSKAWASLRAIVKKIRRFRARIPVLVEEYGEGVERWRVAYCLGVIQMDKPFPHPEMLVISPVPSQLFGADPRLMKPSERIFVLEERGSRMALLGMVLAMGSISPERAGGFLTWPEWAKRNPDGMRDLEHTRIAKELREDVESLRNDLDNPNEEDG